MGRPVVRAAGVTVGPRPWVGLNCRNGSRGQVLLLCHLWAVCPSFGRIRPRARFRGLGGIVLLTLKRCHREALSESVGPIAKRADPTDGSAGYDKWRRRLVETRAGTTERPSECLMVDLLTCGRGSTVGPRRAGTYSAGGAAVSHWPRPPAVTVWVLHRKQQSLSVAVVVLISPVNGGAACVRRVWGSGPVARYRL